MADTMALTLVSRPGRETSYWLASMIQKVEVVVKKVRYVGLVADNNAICANIVNLGEG